MTGLAALALLLGLTPLVEDDARLAYDEARYEDALALWSAALPRSETQGVVLHNMGNCAYRLGRRAEAVLYYRRALLRRPHDEETRFNLRLVENQLDLDRAAPGLPWSPGKPWYAVGPRALLAWAVVLKTLGLMGWGLRRGRGRALPALFLAAGLAVSVMLVVRWADDRATAVVLRASTDVRDEPHRDLPALKELPPGAIVRIEEMSDRWVRISGDHGAGWVERDAIGVVE